MSQRQDSVTDQLRDLMAIARREGMYDADDWIRARLEATRSQTSTLTDIHTVPEVEMNRRLDEQARDLCNRINELTADERRERQRADANGAACDVAQADFHGALERIAELEAALGTAIDRLQAQPKSAITVDLVTALAAPARPTTRQPDPKVPWDGGGVMCTAACPPFQIDHSPHRFHVCELVQGHAGAHRFPCVSGDSLDTHKEK